MKYIEMNNKLYRVHSVWETASGGLANAEFQLQSGKWVEVKNIQIRIELAKLYKKECEKEGGYTMQNKDLAVAVYRKDCYAGETVLVYEDVFFKGEIPEKYDSYEYETKLVELVEYVPNKPMWDTETVKEFVKRLKEHYPHSPSVCNTIDKVAVELMKETERN